MKKTLPTLRKASLTIAVAIVVVILAAGGIFAWTSVNQHKSDLLSGVYELQKPGEDGSLIVSKTVYNASGATLTSEQRKAVFAFTVEFSDKGSYRYRIDEFDELSGDFTFGSVETTLASGQVLYLRHGQRAIFGGIPRGVLYSVVEAPVSGSITSSFGSTGTITAYGSLAAFINLATDEVPSEGKLEVVKIVTGAAAGTAELKREFEFLVTLRPPGTSADDETTQTVDLKAGERWKSDTLPVGTVWSVRELHGSAEATVSSGYSTVPTSSRYAGVIGVGNGGGIGSVAAPNVLLPFVNIFDDGSKDVGSLQLSKEVTATSSASIDRDAEFSFVVEFDNVRSVLASNSADIFINGQREELSAARTRFEFKIKHGQNTLFTELPAGIVYRAAEVLSPSWETSLITTGVALASEEFRGAISSNYTDDVVFVNRALKAKMGEMTVEKLVTGTLVLANRAHPFEFVLEVAGQPDHYFTLTADQQKSFDVPVGAAYTLRELNVPEGFDLVSVTNATGTMTARVAAVFTNHGTDTGGSEVETDTPPPPPTGEKVTITGKKTWVHKTNPAAKRPASLVLRVLADGKVVLQKRITAAEKWKWKLELDKYAADGHKIIYTIDEKPVNNYRKKISGYNLTNTYEPFDIWLNKSGDAITPIGTLLALMVVGSAVVVALSQKNQTQKSRAQKNRTRRFDTPWQ